MENKLRRLALILLATLVTMVATGQTQLTDSQLRNINLTASTKLVSVHDPSVVYNPTDSYYYLVGSHIGVAKSNDLANWTGVSTGTEHSSFFNQSYSTAFNSCPTHEVTVKRSGTEYKETLPSYDAGSFCSIYAANRKSWISGDMWAPDIIYNPNMGKWCLYLSLNGDNWASVIVLMTADKPTGPFKYEAPIVFGGFNGVDYSGKKVDIAKTDMRIVTGSTTLPSRFSSAGKSWGTYYPNCIDPCVFFDEDGELWMTYGSWSGGIWMLKLDKQTGLRDYTTTYTGTSLSANATSDQYFGKKIAGGYYVSGEGSYIQRIGKYYYLFMTYGFMLNNFNATSSDYALGGGYEMRVFRSTSPTGPFKDASGNAATYTSFATNYGPSSATNRGMRLIGPYNDWGNMTLGERNQGHCSAIVGKDGEAYVVFHTRFNHYADNKYDEGHQVRVHRMYVNEKGWLVTAPFKYVGQNNSYTKIATTKQSDIESKEILTAEQIAGTYQFMLHPYKLNHHVGAESIPNGELQLCADGTIKGTYTGTWKYSNSGQSFVTIYINKVYYYGVLEMQTIDGGNRTAVCMTAVSNGGVPLWMYKLEDQSAIARNYASYNSFFSSAITTSAPATTDDVNIAYTSTASAFSEKGIYTPPAVTESTKTVGYTLSKGGYTFTSPTYTKSFTKPTIVTDIESGLVAHYPLRSLTDDNDVDNTQKMTTGSPTTTGTVPEIYSDNSRGEVYHLYYGTSSAINFASMPNPLNGTGAEAFTVSFWAKPMNKTYWDCIFSFFEGEKPSDNGGRFFFTDNTYCGYNDGTGTGDYYFDINYASNAYKDLPIAKWTYVTLVMTSGGLKIYLNGKATTLHSNTASTSYPYAKAISNIVEYKRMCLGMGSYWGSSNCLVSDLSVFSRALTANDVKMLYGIHQSPAVNAPKYILGDANNDGEVSVSDLSLVASYILGEDVEMNMKNADYNEDGIITVADLSAIASLILGNI